MEPRVRWYQMSVCRGHYKTDGFSLESKTQNGGVDQRSAVILQVIWTSLDAGIRTTARKPVCEQGDQ